MHKYMILLKAVSNKTMMTNMTNVNNYTNIKDN